MNRSGRVIIFGGAGFIGSHLIQQLMTSGEYDEVFCLDINEPRFRTEGVTYLTCNVIEPIPVDICGKGPAAIFNLAAVHTTPGHQDWEYYWTNVFGASNVCKFASAIGCTQLLFTSSISVYGPTEDLKDETSELMPTSAYGRSKLMGESVHRLWQSESSDTRQLIIVRPAVIYGYTEHGNFTRLANLLRKDRFVYPGRKDAIKSCGYVKELIQSMLFMMERQTGVEIYNFCRPERYTSEQICAAFSKVAGYREPRIVVPMWLISLAAMPFEVLAIAGYKTGINRARVKKLFNSTNVSPKRLMDAGFEFQYDITASLADWKRTSNEFQ